MTFFFNSDGGGPRMGVPIKLGGGAILLVTVISLLTGENPLRLLQSLEQAQEAEPPVTETILRHVLRQELPEYLHGDVQRPSGRRRKPTKR